MLELVRAGHGVEQGYQGHSKRKYSRFLFSHGGRAQQAGSSSLSLSVLTPLKWVSKPVSRVRAGEGGQQVQPHLSAAPTSPPSSDEDGCSCWGSTTVGVEREQSSLPSTVWVTSFPCMPLIIKWRESKHMCECVSVCKWLCLDMYIWSCATWWHLVNVRLHIQWFSDY